MSNLYRFVRRLHVVYYHIKPIYSIYNDLNFNNILFLNYSQLMYPIPSKHNVLQIQQILHNVLQVSFSQRLYLTPLEMLLLFIISYPILCEPLFFFGCPKKIHPSIYDNYLDYYNHIFINYPHPTPTASFYVVKIKSSIHFLKTTLVKLAHTFGMKGAYFSPISFIILFVLL